MMAQFPDTRDVWSGGLVLFLKSGPVIQIIKQWAEKCMDDPVIRAQLDKLLPSDDFPWKTQLNAIVELAKTPDAGNHSKKPITDAEVMSAAYTRRLFLCTYETLKQNSPNVPDFLKYRTMDLPGAIILTAFHDLKTMGGQGFFGKLFSSPLVDPMHDNLRKELEQDYVLDLSLNFNKHDQARFHTATSGSRQLPLLRLRKGQEIDKKVHCDLFPFTNKEKLAFLIGLEDWKPSAHEKPVTDQAIDLTYVAERLPGRTIDELMAHFAATKQEFAALQVPLARGSVKRPFAEGNEDYESAIDAGNAAVGSAGARKKARKDVDLGSSVLKTPAPPCMPTAAPENSDSELPTPGNESGKVSRKSGLVPQKRCKPLKFRADARYTRTVVGDRELRKVRAALSRESKAQDACNEAEAACVVARDEIPKKRAGITAANRYADAKEQVSASEAALEDVSEDLRRCVQDFRHRESRALKTLEEGKVVPVYLPAKKVEQPPAENNDDEDDLLEALRSLKKGGSAPSA